MFAQQIQYASNRLRDFSKIVHTEKWQGVDISKRPEMAMHEVRHHFLTSMMQGEDLNYYRREIEPNLPWADDHFEERVCGMPINPGVQWAKWPYGHSASTFLDKDGKFNHNYMERYWPKYAGRLGATEDALDYTNRYFAGASEVEPPHFGIYHQYGDLADVVDQLVREPFTRQAMLPVFFPEDTGAAHGGRVPCSIAYQFIMRNNELDVVYWLRSCDFVRHFRDDIYLTVRLALWVLDECRKKDPKWASVTPGRYVMMITSLHCFRNDFIQLFGGKK